MSRTDAERRREPRRRSLREGRGVRGGGRATMDRIVRDISAKGARPAFAGPALAPPMFELRLVSRGDRRLVQEIRVRDGAMGVAFDRAGGGDRVGGGGTMCQDTDVRSRDRALSSSGGRAP